MMTVRSLFDGSRSRGSRQSSISSISLLDDLENDVYGLHGDSLDEQEIIENEVKANIHGNKFGPSHRSKVSSYFLSSRIKGMMPSRIKKVEEDTIYVNIDEKKSPKHVAAIEKFANDQRTWVAPDPWQLEVIVSRNRNKAMPSGDVEMRLCSMSEQEAGFQKKSPEQLLSFGGYDWSNDERRDDNDDVPFVDRRANSSDSEERESPLEGREVC